MGSVHDAEAVVIRMTMSRNIISVTVNKNFVLPENSEQDRWDSI